MQKMIVVKTLTIECFVAAPAILFLFQIQRPYWVGNTLRLVTFESIN